MLTPKSLNPGLKPLRTWMTDRISLHDLTWAELQDRLVADGLRPAHTGALWRALHRELETDLDRREDFSPPLRRWIRPCPARRLRQFFIRGHSHFRP